MPTYASPSQHPSAPAMPFRPSQLRSPVPPTRPGSSAHPRHHRGLGRPSSWAAAVAALLVGLLLGLVWAGSGLSTAELREVLAGTVSAVRDLG